MGATRDRAAGGLSRPDPQTPQHKMSNIYENNMKDYRMCKMSFLKILQIFAKSNHSIGFNIAALITPGIESQVWLIILKLVFNRL